MEDGKKKQQGLIIRWIGSFRRGDRPVARPLPTLQERIKRTSNQ